MAQIDIPFSVILRLFKLAVRNLNAADGPMPIMFTNNYNATHSSSAVPGGRYESVTVTAQRRIPDDPHLSYAGPVSVSQSTATVSFRTNTTRYRELPGNGGRPHDGPNKGGDNGDNDSDSDSPAPSEMSTDDEEDSITGSPSPPPSTSLPDSSSESDDEAESTPPPPSRRTDTAQAPPPPFTTPDTRQALLDRAMARFAARRAAINIFAEQSHRALEASRARRERIAERSRLERERASASQARATVTRPSGSLPGPVTLAALNCRAAPGVGPASQVRRPSLPPTPPVPAERSARARAAWERYRRARAARLARAAASYALARHL